MIRHGKQHPFYIPVGRIQKRHRFFSTATPLFHEPLYHESPRSQARRAQTDWLLSYKGGWTYVQRDALMPPSLETGTKTNRASLRDG
ncbi:hypothetical protein HMPREF1153_1657 [Selenomonas sp. CM52]|nr:hypothetical protein HMPREF1153_1657 [Selenomonas sp. CM52]